MSYYITYKSVKFFKLPNFSGIGPVKLFPERKLQNKEIFSHTFPWSDVAKSCGSIQNKVYWCLTLIWGVGTVTEVVTSSTALHTEIGSSQTWQTGGFISFNPDKTE
jgi:hypothetical protein